MLRNAQFQKSIMQETPGNTQFPEVSEVSELARMPPQGLLETRVLPVFFTSSYLPAEEKETKMRAEDKLRAYWSKRERDVILHWPGGVATKCDGHWLSGVFDKKFIAELEKRGYDLSTMRFSVEPQKGNQRFTSQQEPTAT